MRNSRFIFLLFSALFAHQLLFSQGYRGNKFSISYQPGYSMIDPSYDFKHVIFHQKMNLGFSIADHWSINLIGSYTNSRTMKNSKYNEFQIKDYTGGLSINYFKRRKQCFAPIGRFVGFSVEYGSQNQERIEYVTINQGSQLFKLKFYDSESRGSLMIFSVNTGKNYLIKDRYLLGYGIQYGISTGNGPAVRHFIKPQFNFGIIF